MLAVALAASDYEITPDGSGNNDNNENNNNNSFNNDNLYNHYQDYQHNDNDYRSSTAPAYHNNRNNAAFVGSDSYYDDRTTTMTTTTSFRSATGDELRPHVLIAQLREALQTLAHVHRAVARASNAGDKLGVLERDEARLLAAERQLCAQRAALHTMLTDLTTPADAPLATYLQLCVAHCDAALAWRNMALRNAMSLLGDDVLLSCARFCDLFVLVTIGLSPIVGSELRIRVRQVNDALRGWIYVLIYKRWRRSN